MGRKIWADVFESGELSNTTMFQTIKFNKNVILRAIRTWIVCYNDPTFTSLNMKIYSNEVVGSSNTPRKLLSTSTNSLTKSEIITLDNGYKEIYFIFNDEPFNGNDYYNIVLNGTGYVYAADSFLAWVKAFPDPVYSSGTTPTLERLKYSPYALYGIGGEL